MTENYLRNKSEDRLIINIFDMTTEQKPIVFEVPKEQFVRVPQEKNEELIKRLEKWDEREVTQEYIDQKLNKAEEKRNELLEEAKSKAKERNEKVHQISQRKKSEDEQDAKQKKEKLDQDLKEADERREKLIGQTKDKAKSELEKVEKATPNEEDRQKAALEQS